VESELHTCGAAAERYVWSEDGFTLTAEAEDGTVSAIVWGSEGQLLSRTGDASVEAFTYDDEGRLLSHSVTDDGALTQLTDYEHDCD